MSGWSVKSFLLSGENTMLSFSLNNCLTMLICRRGLCWQNTLWSFRGERLGVSTELEFKVVNLLYGVNLYAAMTWHTLQKCPLDLTLRFQIKRLWPCICVAHVLDSVTVNVLDPAVCLSVGYSHVEEGNYLIFSGLHPQFISSATFTGGLGGCSEMTGRSQGGGGVCISNINWCCQRGPVWWRIIWN